MPGPEILRQSAMQMVIAISLITRACPDATFQEIHDMWVAHAEADAAEAEAEDAANAGGAGSAALQSWFAGWATRGFQPKKCICVCMEPGCPTFDLVYKKGRGFVSRYQLAEEEEAARPPTLRTTPDHWGSYCGDCMTPEMCYTCQPLVCEGMEALALPAPATSTRAPAPAPAPKKTWAQVVVG